MNTFELNTGELAFCIGLSAEIGRGVEGEIPSGNLKINANNKPFIEAVIEKRRTELVLPWDDLKVAFSVTDDERLWTDAEAGTILFPDGWSLNETDTSGARCVAVFRVETIPNEADGKAVEAILTAYA